VITLEQIKCKSCGYSYYLRKDEKTCPYCHKKRSKAPRNIFIGLLIIAISAIIMVYNNASFKYIDGVLFSIDDVIKTDSFLYGDIVRVSIKCQNISRESKSFFIELTAYDNNKEIPILYLDNYLSKDLLKGKYAIVTVDLKPDDDFKSITLYSKNVSFSTPEDYKKFLTIKNKNIK
jgi:RNA polymerase subunit RPABC4/transcription elongation factor Spt4